MTRNLCARAAARAATLCASLALTVFLVTTAVPGPQDAARAVDAVAGQPAARTALARLLLPGTATDPGPSLLTPQVRSVVSLQLAAALDGQPGARLGGDPLAAALTGNPGATGPSVPVPAGLDRLAALRRTLSTTLSWLLRAALACAGVALAVSPRRGRTAARLGRWSLGAGVSVVLTSVVLPHLVGATAWGAVLAGSMSAHRAAAGRVGIALLVVGATMVLAGRSLDAATRTARSHAPSGAALRAGA